MCDIKCVNTRCTLRQECLRSTAKAVKNQVYAEYKQKEGDCEQFISNAVTKKEYAYTDRKFNKGITFNENILEI